MHGQKSGGNTNRMNIPRSALDEFGIVVHDIER